MRASCEGWLIHETAGKLRRLRSVVPEALGEGDVGGVQGQLPLSAGVGQRAEPFIGVGERVRWRRARSVSSRAGFGAPVRVVGPVVTAARATQQVAGLEVGMRRELVDQRVDHRRDRFGGSALSESVSKSACAFPNQIQRRSGLISSAAALSARARRCSISSFLGGRGLDRAARSGRRHRLPCATPRCGRSAGLLGAGSPRAHHDRLPRTGQDGGLVLGGERAALEPVSSRSHAPSSMEESARVIVIGWDCCTIR